MRAEAEHVELHQLDRGWRLRPATPAQVEAARQLVDDCPPILVRSPGNVLVDGHLRVDAALAAGRTKLPVRYTTGTDAKDVELALVANAAPGRPLTTRDRRAAATRLLQLRPEWSARRVARIAGLSPTTVATLPRPTVQNGHSDVRQGDDGRRRPAMPAVAAERRQRVRTLLLANELSPAQIAHETGVARSTVYRLRQQLATERHAANWGGFGRILDWLRRVLRAITPWRAAARRAAPSSAAASSTTAP